MHGWMAKSCCPCSCFPCFYQKNRERMKVKEISDMKFTKMQAFGNDYVYIDAIHQKLNNLPSWQDL